MASDSETLVKDWQAVLKQAKEMQLALHKFVSTVLHFFMPLSHASPALQVCREPQFGGRSSIG
jgi:hypothetical protein